MPKPPSRFVADHNGGPAPGVGLKGKVIRTLRIERCWTVIRNPSARVVHVKVKRVLAFD
jgi:hypothetical protein